MPTVVHRLLPKLDMMRASIICIIGMGLWSHAAAESLLEGRVRLPSGAPVPGAQVLLFDLADLRAVPLAATTDRSGRFILSLASLSGAQPVRFELGANYPNPFNPSTMIPYQLPAAMHVRLEVCNLLGQRVATLVEGEQPAGFHTASWDATDEAGQAVGTGVYLYRLSGDGVQATRSMLLIDGQAGLSRGGRVGAPPTEEEAEEKAPLYGLTISAPGLVPYVDPAFRVEAGMAPLDLVVQAPGSVSSAKVASSGGILGDVDNTGRVGFFDALLVALYSRDASIVMPNNGDISLGDVDADGRVDLTDAWLIAVWLNDPSDPALPSGIGEPVGPAASLSPDPSTVTFADDGAWHRFSVEAGEPVSVVANPGTTPGLEITTRSGRGNYCPAEADDDAARRDGQTVYLSGCATGPATVELRRQSDGTVLRTYTFEVTGSPADLVVASVSVSDSSLTPGQSFTLSATVRNQGTARSGATTLQYYRSTNRTISTRDTLVGSDAVGALGASRTSAESIRLTAPSSAGTWYYGACVAGVAGESAGNNCSSAVTVTVGAAPAPDLVVDAPTVSNSSPTAGASFTLRATVRNQGSGQSAATTLRWYRSSNATVSTSDIQVGTDPVSSLSASRTSSESIRLTAPSSEGTVLRSPSRASAESISLRAPWHLLLRSLRRERQRRNQYRKQLLRSRNRNRGRRTGPRSRRRCSYGQQQRPRGRRFLHPERYRAQPGCRTVKLDHPALLPLYRRDGFHQRHPGRNRPGQQPVRFSYQCRVDQPAGPLQRRHLLLRGLCRERQRRIRHRKQLLGCRDRNRGRRTCP